MQFPDEIMDLFDPEVRSNGVGLSERYQVRTGEHGKRVNGVLCSIWWCNATNDRIEAVIHDEDDVVTLILDRGRWTVNLPVEAFKQIVPLVFLALEPRK